jgi:HK97 family phage major capsid protein
LRTRSAALVEGPDLPIAPPTPMPMSLADQFLGSADWQSWLGRGNFSNNVRIDSPKIAVAGSLIAPYRFRAAQGSHVPQMGSTQYSAKELILPSQSGIWDEGPLRRQLTILDLITRGTTDSDSVDYVRTTAFTNNAAVVPEADDVLYTDDTGRKPWSALTLERLNVPVYTVAHGEAATTRALADAGQMRTLIESWLRYGLQEELEDLVVNGGGTTTFDGLTHVSGTQSQAWDTNLITTIRKAKTKVRLNGKAIANGVLMHPNDWEALDLALTLAGTNSNRDAGAESTPRIWGLPVVESEAIAEGTAIVGDFRRAVLWDRQQTTVQATNGYMDFFMKNLVAILAELRAAFGVIRPSAFVITETTSS